ncbi:unnamed protein product [Darwinula stevensoni]|uniref:Uncharacterized protein n=1 Tax=Darwinula stevensoni TaxID=69355 RepID=A0A7R8XCT1_9CRUS|nr:unnamed protein product [Darwinula stevensoni]CAG0892532.1 unnamed protein product [Darwinula stevensoni]
MRDAYILRYGYLIPRAVRSESPSGRMLKAASSPHRRHEPDDGLILPQKITNPCLQSPERRNLHRELLFNQKTWTVTDMTLKEGREKERCDPYDGAGGRNVLNQKTELQRALQRHQDNIRQKEQELEKTSQQTSLEKALHAQALKLHEVLQPSPYLILSVIH